MIFVAGQALVLALLLLLLVRGDGPTTGWTGPVPSVLAVISLGLGGLLAVAGLTALGRNLRIQPEPREDSALVEAGVYGHLRHPLYTALILVSVGLALLRGTWPLWGCVGALMVLLLAKARHEERLLAARFPGYYAYRARTWGVLPLRRRRRGSP